MSATLSLDDMVHHSGVPRRTIERILADFKHRGTGNRLRVPKPLLGAQRALTTENAQVSTAVLFIFMPVTFFFTSSFKDRSEKHRTLILMS
jgi:hypothetical protein